MSIREPHAALSVHVFRFRATPSTVQVQRAAIVVPTAAAGTSTSTSATMAMGWLPVRVSVDDEVAGLQLAPSAS